MLTEDVARGAANLPATNHFMQLKKFRHFEQHSLVSPRQEYIIAHNVRLKYNLGWSSGSTELGKVLPNARYTGVARFTSISSSNKT